MDSYKKLLTFSHIKNEDYDKIAQNWPFPDPPLNCREAHKYCVCKNCNNVMIDGECVICEKCGKEINPDDIQAA